MRNPFKTFSALTATAAICLVPVVSQAAETPEQPEYSETNKFVYARTHVDAPKVFWDGINQRFELLTTYTVRTEDGERTEYTLPIDYAMNWVGKGWRGRNPAHIFQVSNHPSVSYLGTPGTVLYASPQIAGARNTPIWAGFGADTQIPIDRFRDGEFSLNLIGIDGPGKVEYFISGPSGEVVRRLFSSHDTKLRETLLQPAQHTHNFTTFSKPGTYRMYFQAFARDKVGNPIVSKPQVHEWRVGGNDPRSATHLKDFRAAFAAAPTVAKRENTPTFQMLPKAPATYENPGDQHYTDFKFNTGNPADNGVLVITIDGFELIQLPVENGVANGSEMLGDEAANFQAIFVPAANAPTGRWASAQFSYQRAQAGVEQTAEATEIAPENSLNPAPVYPLRLTDLTDTQVDLSITPLPDQPGKYLVNITGRDPNFKGHVRGGFKEQPNQVFFDCFLDADLATGTYQRVHDFSYCQKDFHLALTVNPFPSINATGTNYAKQVSLTDGLKETFTLGKTSYTGEIPSFENPKKDTVPGDPLEGGSEKPKQPQTPKPENPGSESPIVDGGAAGADQGAPGVNQSPGANQTPGADPKQPAPPSDKNLTLTKGHLDISANLIGKEMGIVVKDDTLEHASQTRVPRDPQALTLFVPRAAKQTRTSEQSDARFDFLGAVGEHFYLLPEVQDHQLLWPGFSTEEIDYAAYPAGIDFVVTPVKTPAGAKAVGFSVDPFAEADQSVTTFFDTTKPGKYRLQTTGPTHRHLNWLFTKAGSYELAVQLYSAEKALGKPVHIRFEIDQQQANPPVGETEKPAGEAKQTPGITPSDKTAGPAANPKPQVDTNLGGGNHLVSTNPPAVAGNAPNLTSLVSALPGASQPTTLTPGSSANGTNTTAAKPAETATATPKAVGTSEPQAMPAADPMRGAASGYSSVQWTAMGVSLAGVLLLLAGLGIILAKARKKG
ncbi:MAG: choice-of-anchor M domain-containing protein [Actinomycetaceae bacterium]|nr:choice-of-anchor M domain-containing protein [Actinomycetaceae bacterium]